jgi:RimJ/RimL family protein N-acetyltransferase
MIPDCIKTSNLSLRPFSEDDADAVFAYWISDSDWERFNASVPASFTLSDAENFVVEMCARSRDMQPNWAIVHQNVVAGIVSLIFEEHQRIATIGYGIHGDFRGRGFVAEAARTIIDLAFGKHVELGKIRAHTDAQNIASIRVLEKLGFSKEGTLRKNQYVKNELRDEVICGLLREDWVQRGAT